MNAFDLATRAGYVPLDMDKLRKGIVLISFLLKGLLIFVSKDIPTLLFRQPTATPTQKAFLNQYPKDVTRILGSFLVLHDLFFSHFLRAKVDSDRFLC